LTPCGSPLLSSFLHCSFVDLPLLRLVNLQSIPRSITIADPSSSDPVKFRPIYAATATPYLPTVFDVLRNISELDVISVQLKQEHVEALLDLMVYDGQVEKILVNRDATTFGTSTSNETSSSRKADGKGKGKARASSKSTKRRKGSSGESSSESDDGARRSSSKKAKRSANGKARRKRAKLASDAEASSESESEDFDSDDDAPSRRRKKGGAASDDDDDGGGKKSSKRRKTRGGRRVKRSSSDPDASTSESEDGGRGGSGRKGGAALGNGVGDENDDDEAAGGPQTGTQYVYRLIRSYAPTIGWTDMPCGKCPVEEFCAEPPRQRAVAYRRPPAVAANPTNPTAVRPSVATSAGAPKIRIELDGGIQGVGMLGGAGAAIGVSEAKWGEMKGAVGAGIAPVNPRDCPYFSKDTGWLAI